MLLYCYCIHIFTKVQLTAWIIYGPKLSASLWIYVYSNNIITFFKNWIWTTNHKRIGMGILYVILGMLVFFLAMLMSIAIVSCIISILMWLLKCMVF